MDSQGDFILLATLFAQALRALLLTCAHFGQDQIAHKPMEALYSLAPQPKATQDE